MKKTIACFAGALTLSVAVAMPALAGNTMSICDVRTDSWEIWFYKNLFC